MTFLLSVSLIGILGALVSSQTSSPEVWTFSGKDLKHDLKKLAVSKECSNKLNVKNNLPKNYLQYNDFRLLVYCTENSKKTLRTRFRVGPDDELFSTEVAQAWTILYKKDNQFTELTNEYFDLEENTEDIKFGEGGITRYSAGIYRDISDLLTPVLTTVADLHLQSDYGKGDYMWSSLVFNVDIDGVPVRIEIEGPDGVVHLGSERILTEDVFLDCKHLVYGLETLMYTCDDRPLRKWSLGRFYDYTDDPTEPSRDDGFEIPLVLLKKHLDEIPKEINVLQDMQGTLYSITGTVDIQQKRVLKFTSMDFRCSESLLKRLVKIEGVMYQNKEEPTSQVMYSNGVNFFKDKDCNDVLNLQEFKVSGREFEQGFVDVQVHFRALHSFKKYLQNMIPNCGFDRPKIQKLELQSGKYLWYHCDAKAFYIKDVVVLKKNKYDTFAMIYFVESEKFAGEDDKLEEAIGMYW